MSNNDKLAQDITLRQSGFLTQLEWRDLIRRHASLDATKKQTGEVRLRWTLSTQLIEIPTYLAVASRLLDSPFTDVKPVDYLNMARCMLTLRERFQSCYVEDLVPQLIAGDRRKYSNIFAAIIDFVSNMALAQMEGTYCRLLSSQSSGLSGDHYLCDLPIRQRTMIEAIAFVKQSSKAAAKPLEQDHQSLDAFTMVKLQSENARMKLWKQPNDPIMKASASDVIGQNICRTYATPKALSNGAALSSNTPVPISVTFKLMPYLSARKIGDCFIHVYHTENKNRLQ